MGHAPFHSLKIMFFKVLSSGILSSHIFFNHRKEVALLFESYFIDITSILHATGLVQALKPTSKCGETL
jgi:hypothetical protein